jgi:fructose-1-phosphate kinase PfkB-like protein
MAGTMALAVAGRDEDGLGAGGDQVLHGRDLAGVVAVGLACADSSLAPSFLASAVAPSFIFTKKGLVSVLVMRPMTGLGLLLPGRSIDQFAADALAAGTPLVVVTRGAEGAVGYTRQGRVTAPPVAVQVADTVGAGDTFQAALLTWAAETGRLTPAGLAQLDDAALAEALGFAARAAAITCSRRGADLPRRAELG